MIRSTILFSFLLFFVFGCQKQNRIAGNNTQNISSEHQITEDLINNLKDADSNQVMVIAHRGDWRNAPENSIQAIKNCIEMGVDMVEIDVRMTKDSQLVIIHDSKLDRTTTGKGKVSDWTLDSLKTLYLRNGAGHPTHHHIPTLEEAMLAAKGKILVNLDKCYNYFDLAYEVLEKTGTIDHVVMKSSVPFQQVEREFGQYLDKIHFMPIVDLNRSDAKEIINDYQQNMKPVAFEVLFQDEGPDLLNDFRNIRGRGSRVWVNTLWESLNAGYEDDMAVEDPDAVYGWLVAKGVNMIQTDRPQLLLSYLRSKQLHD